MRKAFWFIVPLILLAGFVFGLKSPHSKVSGKPVAEAEGEVEQDGPDELYKWMSLAMRDEKGNIPRDGLEKAKAQRLANLDYWHSRGVNPLTQTWLSVGATNIAGRTLGLAIDPRNENRMFAATAGGGLWKSTDGGAHWSIVDDRWKVLSVGSVSMVPSNPDVMYAGTGEGNFNGDWITGNGMYKSTDGGATWTYLASTAGWQAVNSIGISPDGSVLLAGVQNYGIARSTDGGATWTKVVNTYTCQDVRVCPTDSTKWVASVYGGAYDAIYSSDGGATWTTANITQSGWGSYGRIALSFSVSNPSIVYAYGGLNYGTLYKSTDYGHTYSTVSTVGGSNQVWYDQSLWVDPTNPNVILTGQVDCRRSTNGGSTWTAITYWPYGNPHADHHFYVSSPSFDGVNNKTVFLCTDGGIFKTTNIYTATTTTGWTGLNQNQPSTQYYGAAGDGPTGKIIGGLQDNGTVFTATNNTTATTEFGGDGGFAAMDPTNPNYAYGEYVYLQIHRTTNGSNGNYIYSGITDAGGNAANFIAPFILSPSNPNRMLAGGSSLWVSNNVKDPSPSWTAIRGAGTANISAIAEAPSNSSVIWVGQNDGGISFTLDGGSSWNSVNVLPARFVGRILIDKDDSNVVYVTFGGYNSNNVWKTTNSGGTWTQITGSGATALPAAPVRAFARHPANANYLFAGTEVGVFASTDGGATWSASDFGPANVAVYDLEFMNNSSNVLLAATHGRGVWATVVGAGQPGVTGLSVGSSVVGGNILVGRVTLSSEAPAGGTVVTLSSDNAAAVVPATVTVRAGYLSNNFAINTKGVDANTTVNISATASGLGTKSSFVVTPARIPSILLSPSTVEGGVSTNAVVRLNGAAGPSGLSVSLQSSVTGVAQVPASISFGPNDTAKSLTVTTSGVDVASQSDISAIVGPNFATSTLNVNPTTLQAVVCNPVAVAGGKNVGISLIVNGKAGPSGTAVSLSSNSAALTVPASATVAAGLHQSAITVASHPVDSPTVVTVTGTSGSTKSGTVTINPASVNTLTLVPATVYGGSATSGVVRLDAPAGPSGVTVTLSSDTAGVTVPASVQIPAGGTAVSFTIRTKGVDGVTVAGISAKAGFGGTVVSYLTVNPAVVSSITLVPTSLTGGTTGSVVVRLLGVAGPSGLTVTLGSDNAAAIVPATVQVPALGTAVSFKVKTTTVTSAQTANISGTTGATTVSAALSITP